MAGIGCEMHKTKEVPGMRDDLFNIFNEGIYEGILSTMPTEFINREVYARKLSYNIAKGLIEHNFVEKLSDYIIGYIKDQRISIPAYTVLPGMVASGVYPVTGVLNVPFNNFNVS